MFGTVELYERENTLKNRIGRLFLRERIVTERVNLPENEYFYRVKVPVHKGKIPEERFKGVAASFNDGLIFPDSFPYKGEAKMYTSAFFRELLLFNSAVSQLSQSIFEPTETLITVIDRKGVLHTEVSRLVNFAGEIKVITDNVKAYQIQAEKIMSEYGLSVFVSDKLSAIPERGIIISFRSNVVPVYFKGLLITGERRIFPFARVLTGEGIKAPGNYETLCPDGISLTDFLSALCEVCFVKELRRSEYEKLVDISL
ncbi:MAG: hypothetical protein IJB74_05210 [Clostridia bacterium]|nr:hypothetical protein [Clostridia bacterium]